MIFSHLLGALRSLFPKSRQNSHDMVLTILYDRSAEPAKARETNIFCCMSLKCHDCFQRFYGNDFMVITNTISKSFYFLLKEENRVSVI